MRTMLSTGLSISAPRSLLVCLCAAGGSGGDFRDSVVRVQWDAPSIVGYGGYSTLEKAQEAIAAAKKPFRDVFVTATLHEDLPAVGNFTVRFRNLPPGITKKDMKPFGDLDDLMWERLKYESVPEAIAGIKKILSFHFNVLDFDVPPPPYVDGLVRAWLRFASPRGGSASRQPPPPAETHLHRWENPYFCAPRPECLVQNLR